MSLLACLKRMLASRLGNVSIIFALASPLVIGSAALSVETSYWYYKKHQLQAAADDAAYAAGQELRNGSPLAVVNTAALNAASQNGYDNSIGTISVQTPPSTGPYAGNNAAVTVILTQIQKRFFTQVFSTSQVLETASATANWQSAADACVLALDPAAAKAAYFSGSSQLTLTGCVVMSDSFSGSAVNIWGNSSLTVSCVISSGGIQDKGGLTDTGCKQPITSAPPAPDPFAGVPAPPVSATCADGSASALQPGTYCGGLSLKGDVSLAPGVYVINGGSLTINGNTDVTGSGVTFYLTGGATVSMNGNATINLSAPTSGTYSGILFYGDRNYPGLSETFNGTASSSMTGTIYFPTDNISYLGNYAGADGCTYIVGDTVSFSGNTGFNMDCTKYGMAPIPALTLVKLVG